MSLGINLLMQLLKEATKVLSPAGYDIEIVEKHHNQKLDAPSGTAIALADSINEAADGQYEYVYDRSQVRKKRDKKELGISAVRGGTIVGEHEVLFAGIDEVIEFKHTAYSRTVFGKGAVEAAKFLAGFTEIGETLEETVSREVMEEVGLKVNNITYYKNQPRAFSDTLLMGYFCELDGSDQVKLDENELALAEWFGRNQIPVEPDDISLTNEMMMVFRDGYTI